MKNLKMYCLTLNPEHLKLIKAINYIPVGLGNSFFNSEWVTDKFLNGIDKKNPFYGEYTFHYYLWKNANLENQGWIGFCQYRKFWIKVSRSSSNMNKIHKIIITNLIKINHILNLKYAFRLKNT